MLRSVILYFVEDVFDLVFIRPLLLDSWFGDLFWQLYKRNRRLERDRIENLSFLLSIPSQKTPKTR